MYTILTVCGCVWHYLLHICTCYTSERSELSSGAVWEDGETLTHVYITYTSGIGPTSSDQIFAHLQLIFSSMSWRHIIALRRAEPLPDPILKIHENNSLTALSWFCKRLYCARFDDFLLLLKYYTVYYTIVTRLICIIDKIRVACMQRRGALHTGMGRIESELVIVEYN